MESEIVALVAALRFHYPELTTDTAVLDACVRLGALMLATQATRPGAPPYAGYSPADLAAQLGPKVLPVLDFLLQHGWRTSLLAVAPAVPPAADALPPGAIDPGAADDVAGLGGSFLDDD